MSDSIHVYVALVIILVPGIWGSIDLAKMYWHDRKKS